MKKRPAPRPKTDAENPRSRFICSAAKPMLARSRNAATYMSHRNGISRHPTLRKAADSISAGSFSTQAVYQAIKDDNGFANGRRDRALGHIDAAIGAARRSSMITLVGHIEI